MSKPRLYLYNPLVERFWARVKKAGPDECWLWTGGKNAGGYGYLTIHGGSGLAHVFSWALDNDQEPPKGMNVCHSCDNPPCVNPKHLFLGTPSENSADAIAKGRRKPRGPAQNRDVKKGVYPITTPQQVRAIRAWSGMSQSEFAQYANISHSALADYELERRQTSELTLRAIAFAVSKIPGVSFDKKGRTVFKP